MVAGCIEQYVILYVQSTYVMCVVYVALFTGIVVNSSLNFLVCVYHLGLDKGKGTPGLKWIACSLGCHSHPTAERQVMQNPKTRAKCLSTP